MEVVGFEVTCVVNHDVIVVLIWQVHKCIVEGE